MPYIYKITNKINNKIYIGKTSHSSIEERFKEHIRDSRKTRYEKRPLYDAMNKYGVENFSIEQIEQVKNDEIASEREQFWIEKLRTYIGFSDCNGYNATLGGDSKRYYNYTEIAKKYLELKSEKEVKQVILNFKDHEKQYFFIPDLLNLCKHNITVNELSSILRDFVYNPVITKVFMNYKETDVRLYPDHPYTISQILESNFIIMDNSLIKLKDLGIIEIKYIPSKIHRLNGNRCAYLTLQMNSLNHKIKNKIAKKLSQLRLEEGYTITSENTEEQLTQMFNTTSLYLLISVVAIILILTALYENIRKTLVIVLCPFTLILLILIIVILFNFEMNYVLYEALLVILSIYTTILNEFYVD